MRSRILNGTQRAFTLIEILIVVVILGILAAIVIPQFSNAASDANDASVRSQLQTIRGQLELYNVQHGDVYPDLVANQWADLVGGDYLQAAPKNPLDGGANQTDVLAACAAGVAWQWVAATGELNACDAAGAVFVE